MKQSKIIVAGIGPGSEQDITPAVLAAVREADVVVGYKYYFRFIRDFVRPDAECIDTGMKRERQSNVEIIALPGISAFQKAASLLGAPIGHDFCVISLSDLMTPWERIERRILAAAQADFVTAVYNPKSDGRYWQIYRLREIFLREGRSPETPVGYVRQAGREEQEIHITTLAAFDPETVDMRQPVSDKTS